MRLRDIIERLDLRIFAGGGLIGDREVLGGYASDLMSDVIANAEKDWLWVTIQTHANVVAVAVLKELSAVVFSSGKEPEPDTLERAREEKIILLGSPYSTFDTVGRLYSLGIRTDSTG